MLTTIAGGILAAALAAAPQTDTTFSVQPGARLEVNNMGGEIAVRAWDRNEVRIQAEHSSRTRVDVRNTGSVVTVRAGSGYGPANIVDYRITVPASMALDLSGMHTDIDVQGTQAEVKAQTVQGEVSIRGGRSVSARSVSGEVSVEGARGDVRASTTSENVRVASAVGEVIAETVSGDIFLERIDSRRVEAGTVSGDVFYDGTIQDRGRYSFVTHSGDVVASVPERADVKVSIASIDGDLDASFPVTFVGDDRGRRQSFVLGSGSAQLEMETFSGDVLLRRPGEVSAALEQARERARERAERRSNRERVPRAPRAPRPPREPQV